LHRRKKTVIAFQDIDFIYPTSIQPLFEGLTAHFPAGWTGIVGANGAGKSTALKLATGLLKPTHGSIAAQGESIYCAQRTDFATEDLTAFVESVEAEACVLKGRLAIEEDWTERWGTLSHGERKRVQIGAALWRRPAALAVDEPTNHLDREAREMVNSALRAYTRVGLLVSHDRELLDSLCSQCLFLDPPEAVMRQGGYTQGAEQAKLEADSARHEFRQAKRERKRLEREEQKRREEASRMLKKRSKRGLAIKDHDARFKRNRARYTGKDGVGGKLKRQIQGRLDQARRKHEGIQIKKDYDTGIWMPNSQSKRNTLFDLPAGSLALGERRRLIYPELAMRPTDRVALTGPNGAGKSTLVRRIVESLSLPEGKTTFISQEIAIQRSKDILNEARRLPGEQLGRMMAVVSRLGSRPERLLESDEPSPGEIRKLLLAIGIAREPHLIILDEPTNHLDLPSIECMEEALDGCPCGLLLVSHDQRFLDRLTRIRWDIAMDEDRKNVFTLDKSKD